jgi:hypothetical protein
MDDGGGGGGGDDDDDDHDLDINGAWEGIRQNV